jgi:hypothetical protein
MQLNLGLRDLRLARRNDRHVPRLTKRQKNTVF